MRLPFGVHAALLLASCSSDHDVGIERRYLLGAYASSSSGASDDSALEEAMVNLERDVDRPLDLDRIFRRWDDAIPGPRERRTVAAGRTPVVSFKSETNEGPIPWQRIASGVEDPHLAAIADGYRDLAATAMLLFHQKPEEDAPAFGTAEDYKASFRHVVLLFRAHGATNVRWVFNMKSSSFPVTADQFYPGDDIVDWLGVQAFNYGAGEPGGRWLSFRAIVADFRAWALRHEKPLLVAEWGTVEDPATSERKAQWIRDVQDTLLEWPELRALAYSDGSRTPTLGVRSSKEALAAFRALAADPAGRPRER
jgi:hypothetical protein